MAGPSRSWSKSVASAALAAMGPQPRHMRRNPSSPRRRTAARQAASRRTSGWIASLRPAAQRRIGRGAAHADRRRAFRARQRTRGCQGARYRRAPAGGRGSQAPCQQRRHRAGRTRSRRSPPQGRRRAPPPGRRTQAQGRARGQEAFWRKYRSQTGAGSSDDGGNPGCAHPCPRADTDGENTRRCRRGRGG